MSEVLHEFAIDDEFESLILPLTDGEYQLLKASIEANGCLDPVIVWQEEQILLDGHNRVEICDELETQFDVREMSFESRAAAKEWVILHQLGRRNLPVYHRCELALALEPSIRARAKANQSVAGGSGGLSPSLGGEKLSPTLGKALDTERELARLACVSHGTMHKVIHIRPRIDDKTREQLRARPPEKTVNGVYKQLTKAAKKAKQIAATETAELPDGIFNVIVADPPWQYFNREDDAEHRAANPYPSMSIEAITNYGKQPDENGGWMDGTGVQTIADENAILWLWTTNAHIEHSFGIAREWGFEPKTILTWAKDRMGMGEWLRGQTEHCLMCVRGKPVVRLTSETTLIKGPMREHSRKPDEFYAMVEKLCPGKARAELFSRTEREGWTTAGAEKGMFNDNE